MHQRGAVVGLRLAEGAQRLLGIGAHRDPGDVDVAVGDRLQGEVLLGHGLAGGGELGDRAERGRLGHLAAGVGVDLGVEHQHVDVAPAGQDVVEPAGADVVGPAVAADDPDAAPDQVVDDAEQVGDGRRRPARRAAASARPPARAARAAPTRAAAAPPGWRRPAPRRPRRAARRAAAGPGRCAGRRRAGSRARTRRCPRTASSTRPVRARRRRSSTGVVGRLPP